nr:hypothetical protein [Tanacetum cinerariifolium]
MKKSLLERWRSRDSVEDVNGCILLCMILLNQKSKYLMNLVDAFGGKKHKHKHFEAAIGNHRWKRAAESLEKVVATAELPKSAAAYTELLMVILFEIRCQSLDINTIISLFWVFYKLCKQGHWFSFKKKIEGHSKKCFQEVTSSLKGWKKKFFLIDRRAIPNVMPWRHSDIDFRDDFPTNYNEDDAEPLAEFTIPLCPPHRHLLYVCELTIGCRHLERSYMIKDPNGMVLIMDDFLKLPAWSGTLMSKEDPIPDDHHPKLHTTPPLEVGKLILKKSLAQRNLENPNSKIAAAREKKRVRKNQKPDGLGSEATIFATPLQPAAPKPIGETTTTIARNAIEDARPEPQVADDERDVVDLSEDTRLPTPPVNVIQPLTHTKHMDGFRLIVLSFITCSSLLPLCSPRGYRACKEIITHLATPVKEEFLVELSIVEREMQAHKGLSKKIALLDSALSSCSNREKELLDQLKDMETERDDWRQTASEQKVAYSYHLTMDSLLKISPDILPSTTDDGTRPSTENNENSTTQLTSLRVQQAKATTGPTLDSVTPVNQANTDNSNLNNSLSLDDNSAYFTIFCDEDRGDKGKGVDKGSREKGDEDLQKPYKEVLKSPFTRRIITFSTPSHWMPTDLKIYDGSSDPDDHVTSFVGAANKGEWEMPVWYRMFQQTLDGPARGWFDRLPNGCIDGYADLQEKFAERFALRRKCCKDPTEISAFMSNSKCPELARRFFDRVPKTVTKMMRRVDDFVKYEDAYKSTELPKGEHLEKGQGGHYQSYVPPRPHNRRYDNQKQEVNHLSPDSLVKQPNEILATKLQLQLPSCPLMIGTPKENLDRYCDYHMEKRHYTNDCYQMKRQLEDALELEKLRHLIKDVRQRQSNKGRQSRNNNRKGKVINMKPRWKAIWCEECFLTKGLLQREIGPYWEGGAKGGVRERRPLLKDDDESEKKKVVEEAKVKEMEPEEQTRPKEEKLLVNPVFSKQKVTIGTHFSKEFCFQLINLLK